MATDIILFYFFSGLSLTSATMVIILSNAVHSVLFLILVFCNVSILILILGAEFFSFMFLIVYVGAIAVLFLFVVMMLNIKSISSSVKIISILPISVLIFILITIQVFNVLDSQFVFLETVPLNYTLWVHESYYLTNAEIIGTFLYTKYSLLFFICGLILLVAMIGAIVLTMHQRPTVKKQQISIQLLRNPKGSIKFINLWG